MGINNSNKREREELHRAIWSIANDLRGSVDGWDFKQYVLGMLFYRYISENITEYINTNEKEAGNEDFDYASIDDDMAISIREEIVESKGFFILPSQLFENIYEQVSTKENLEDLNEKLEKIFKSIEESAIGSKSEENFKGLFDDIDVNSNKLGPTVKKRNERLVKLINGIAGMELGSYKDNSIDTYV